MNARLWSFVCSTALAGLFALGQGSPAVAAEYQYWSYFHGEGAAWSMAMTGADFVPNDGTIEGWRYVKTVGDETAVEPRVAPSFDALCASVPAESGKKRVALVVDYGTVDAADESETLATCVQIDATATGFDVLSAATTIESADGMVTCIQGVPSASCKPVPTLYTDTGEKESLPRAGVPALSIFVVILLIGVGALLAVRSRRR